MGNVYDQLCNVSAQPASIRYFSAFMWQIGAGWREAMMDKRCDIPAVCQQPSLTGLQLRAGTQVKPPLSTSTSTTPGCSCIHRRFTASVHTRGSDFMCAIACLHIGDRRRSETSCVSLTNYLSRVPRLVDETWRRSHKVLWHFKKRFAHQHRKEIKFYCYQIEKFQTYRHF